MLCLHPRTGRFHDDPDDDDCDDDFDDLDDYHDHMYHHQGGDGTAQGMQRCLLPIVELKRRTWYASSSSSLDLVSFRDALIKTQFYGNFSHTFYIIRVFKSFFIILMCFTGLSRQWRTWVPVPPRICL